MPAVLTMAASAAFQMLGAEVAYQRWTCGAAATASITWLLVQRRLLCLGHATRRADGALIMGFPLAQAASHVAQANWEPMETWVTPKMAILDSLSRPRVMGYDR